MTDFQLASLLATVMGGIVTLIVTNVFAIINQARIRRYDVEDRRLIAEQLKERHEVLKQEATTLNGLVAENTALTVRAGDKVDHAYHEANDVNNKIANIGSAIAENQVAILEGTKNAGAAYHEANSVNLKIAALSEEITDLLKGQAARARNGVEERRKPKE